MPRDTANWMTLWTAPLELARAAVAAGETMLSAQTVIAARMPMILAAMQNPWTADHRELGLMVTEKIAAGSRSARSASVAAARLRGALDGQAASLGRLGGGAIPSSADLWAMAGRNVTIAASLIALPGEMLRPFHAGATANAKRLGRRGKSA